jgi:hypothetical protein
MSRAGRKSDTSGGMKEGRRSALIGSSAQPRAGRSEAHGAAMGRHPAKQDDDDAAVPPPPRVGFEQHNPTGKRKNKMPPSRRRLIPLQVVVVEEEDEEERQGPASSSSSMDEDFLTNETTRRSTTTAMREDERRGRGNKADAVEGEDEEGEVEVLSDGTRTVLLVERGRRTTGVDVLDIPPELSKYMRASSVHDVIHSLQSAVRSMRSQEDDTGHHEAQASARLQNDGAGEGVEVSDLNPHPVLKEGLLAPEAAPTNRGEIKSHPVMEEARPRGRQRHRQLPHDKRRARRWPFGSRRPSRKKSGGILASTHPAVRPLIAGATVAVVPLPKPTDDKADVPRRVRAAWEAASRAATITGQRGAVVKILPFVERPKQHNVPSRRLSYELPSLLSSSIHESLSEGICDDRDDEEVPGPAVETNKNDAGLLCVAAGAKCYAEDPVASEVKVRPGGGFAKLRCGRAGSGSDDDDGDATASESDDSGMDSSNNRPRMVSFETNHHTTSESVVSIIGTASTVTTVQGVEEGGSVRELESDTTATFSSSSYASSAFREPAAAGASIVEMVRAASCRQASDASSSGDCHDGFESDQETDSSSDSSSSASSSCRSVARRSQRRPSPPREEVATLDEALQSGRQWLW